MMKKRAKKLLAVGLTLSLAMGMMTFSQTIGNFSLGTTQVQAEETTEEPVYNADTSILKYQLDTQEVAKESEFIFDTGLDANASYYMTMTVKSETAVNVKFRGGDVYLNITSDGYEGKNIEGIEWTNFTTGLKDGAKITAYVTQQNVTAWLNGEKIIDNAAIIPENMIPHSGVAWTFGSPATVTDAKVWTVSDQPQYDENKDILKYQEERIELGESSTRSFDVTIPSRATYYVAFDLKTTDGAYFNLRGGNNECRFYIGPTQYVLLGVDEKEDWVQKQTGVADGAKIVIACSDDSVSVWLNREKIIDRQEIKINKGLKGQPGISWVDKGATFSNVKVWMSSDAIETDEPKYDANTNILKTSKDEITVGKESRESFGVDIPTYQEYYMDFVLKSSGGVYIAFRGDDGRFYIDQTQYVLIGLEKEDWIQQKSDLENGVRVTIKSSGKKVSIWLDGEKIIDDVELPKAGVVGEPEVRWTTAETVVQNLKVWVNDEKADTVFDWAKDYSSSKITITNPQGESYTYDAVVTSEVKKAATCTENGLTTYTATYAEYSESKDVVTDMKGHNYAAEFQWTADNKSAKVIVKCLNDATDVKTYDAKITSRVVTPATYFANGVTEYVAAYDKFTDSKKVADVTKLKLGATKITVKSPKKRIIKVSFKTVKGANSYQIQYSLKKNFKKAKTITLKKKTRTIKKLKSKKRYYVRVRACVTNGKNKVYGAWSVKRIKVK